MKLSHYTLFLLLLITACGSRYTLFDGGQSEYRIVVDAAAPETEQYAACELQYWISEVSGVEIPIVGLEEGAPGKRLVVGFNSLLAGEERPDARNDAFTWRSQGGDIFFWGGSKRGTLYAVYSFLEEELGCRWYSSAVSVAPKRDKWRFGKLDHHEEPGLRIRDNCVLDVRTNPVFSARMRNNFIRVPSRTPGQTVEGSAEGYWGVHAIGVLEEGDYQTVSCELRELRSWLISKLLWNPDADVDALVRDFTDGYYGPAGSYVRAYLDLEERILRLTLRYFEDCEGQVLRIGLRTPGGYDGPVPDDRLFLIATDN